MPRNRRRTVMIALSLHTEHYVVCQTPSAGRTSIDAFEPWQLAPEGAAIHPGERTAVIADVHLGYEWARGSAGDCVPAHSLDETLSRLDRLLARVAD